MKLVSATLLLVFLVLCSSNFLRTSMATNAPVAAAPTPPSFCDSKCGERCSKAGMYERCMKYCGICCQDCKCVPKGTYGNKAECPCYMKKLNSKGKPKCP